MTIARMLMAALCALAAGVAVENAKATDQCLKDPVHGFCSPPGRNGSQAN
jgi:hypothetical protein